MTKMTYYKNPFPRFRCPLKKQDVLNNYSTMDKSKPDGSSTIAPYEGFFEYSQAPFIHPSMFAPPGYTIGSCINTGKTVDFMKVRLHENEYRLWYPLSSQGFGNSPHKFYRSIGGRCYLEHMGRHNLSYNHYKSFNNPFEITIVGGFFPPNFTIESNFCWPMLAVAVAVVFSEYPSCFFPTGRPRKHWERFVDSKIYGHPSDTPLALL